MDVKSTVLKTFNDFVSHAPINSELKASLKSHPRVKAFIDNLYKEIIAVEVLRKSRKQKPLKLKTIKDTVEGFTMTFIQGIENAATRSVESDLTRIKREHEAQQIKDLEVSADTGVMHGEFEELSKDGGLVMGQTIEQTHKG